MGQSLAESRMEVPRRLPDRSPGGGGGGTAASSAQRACKSRRSDRLGIRALSNVLRERETGPSSALGTVQPPHVTKWSKRNTEHGCVMGTGAGSSSLPKSSSPAQLLVPCGLGSGRREGPEGDCAASPRGGPGSPLRMSLPADSCPGQPGPSQAATAPGPRRSP